MSDTIVSSAPTTPASSPPTVVTHTEVVTSVPTAPARATTATVAAHHSVLKSLLTGLEALPQNAINAERYLDLKMETVATWVQTKHVTTRLWEVFGIGFALGAIVATVLAKVL